ncbi:MAG: enoyl-CoA hydratase-related protein [Xanthomonadales bacterium]|nr:enoyl-CoA hydratase-related protein [Xanthomonadales bacterium]
MCRSEKMNAFNDPFIGEMIAAFEILQNDNVRAVILRAQNNAKVWSAGRDLESLPNGKHDIEGWDTQLEALGETVLNCPVPVIALIEGNVWGFACEIAFSCDLIVAVPETSFAITPAKLGVPYALSGLRTVIERLGPNLAKEMLFCATGFDAQRLYGHGIINHVVNPDEIEKFVQDMAHKISCLAPLSIAALKQQISDITRAHYLPPKTIIQSEKRAAHLLGSADFREGISALKAKRRPKFQGK